MTYIRVLTAALLAGQVLLVPLAAHATMPSGYAPSGYTPSTPESRQVAAQWEQRARTLFQLPETDWRLDTNADFTIHDFPVRMLQFHGQTDALHDQNVFLEFDPAGRLFYYECRDPRSAVGSVTHAEAEQRANAFLKAYLGDRAEQLVLTRDRYQSTTMSKDKHLFTYERKVNGAIVLGDRAQIEVLNDGGVAMFNLDHWTETPLPHVLPTLSWEQAQAKYRQQLDLRLAYRDLTNNPDSIKLMYQPVSKRITQTDWVADRVEAPVMDAKTGALLLANGQPAGEWRVAADEQVPPPPRSKPLQVPKTQADADAIVRAWGQLPEGATLSSAQYFEFEKGWRLEYTAPDNQRVTVALDAATGKPAMYEYNNRQAGNSQNPKPTLSYEELKKIALETLNSIDPTRAETLLLLSSSVNDYSSSGVRFHFARLVHGIPSGQEMFLILDSQTGRLIGLMNPLYLQPPDVNYPDPTPLVTAEQARNVYASQNPLRLSYLVPRDDQGKEQTPLLVYTSNPEENAIRVDATNGSVFEVLETSTGTNDLPTGMRGHWAETTLKLFAERGLLTYLGTDLNPDQALTREQLVALLTEYLDAFQLTKTNNPYTDIPHGDRFAGNIQTAFNRGWIAPDNQFRPRDTITREEAATILARVLTDAGKNGTPNAVPNYADSVAISPWAQSAVALHQQLGLMQGDAGNFHPQQNITLAEMCTILVQLTKVTNRI